MSVFTNQQLVQSWQSRAGRVQPAFRQLVRRTGQRMLKVSKSHMRQQIYRIPEDTTKTGRKKWVRTGRLLNAEKLVYAPDGSAVTLTNEMPYARARHELGRNGRQTKRIAHWREGIYAELLEDVHQDMSTTLFQVMKG
jgi:hypothetical protein